MASKINPSAVAVILPYAYSKANQINKYCDLYKARGFTRIHVIESPVPELFLSPLFTQKRASIAKNVIREVNKSSFVVFHALSIGTMRLGQILRDFERLAGADRFTIETFKEVEKNLFLDSPTQPNVYAALGYANFPTNPLVARIIEGASSVALQNIVKSFHVEMMDSIKEIENCKFKYNFSRVAIISSKTDPIVSEDYCRRLAASMMGDTRSPLNTSFEDSQVFLRILKSSPHVRHLMTNSNEYELLVDWVTNLTSSEPCFQKSESIAVKC